MPQVIRTIRIPIPHKQERLALTLAILILGFFVENGTSFITSAANGLYQENASAMYQDAADMLCIHHTRYI
jgi:hypothetical protein